VNGDGAIDLSDAVYTLSWLFTGGPAPVAIECPFPVGKGLPATGQTSASFLHDCPGPHGSYMAGCPTEGRFVDNGDRTVTDNCTGLMWQKETADTNGDGQINSPDRVDSCEALTYCENLSFAGHDDWRLPNVRELQSILDYGRFGPAMDTSVFGVAVRAWYWSSSADVGSPGGFWSVDSDAGHVLGASINRGELSYVRAVRLGLRAGGI
jgi:hypothetical protein